ncbi:MAG TPA: DUF2905 domain-containing protein [Vicinamibacteria bacterium]|nr:DUF2905 domain-containing protein [Vicinamibacteria bacterium]
MGDVGRMLLVLGLVIAAVGAVMMLSGRVPWLGRLPGDLSWRKGNVTVHVPVMTSILVSILLTVLLWLVRR